MEGTDSDDYRAKRWVDHGKKKDEDNSRRRSRRGRRERTRANTGELAGKLLISINSAPLSALQTIFILRSYKI